ncbi:MAG: hypothetical protein ACRCXY_11040 [Fusobacteriaceae bacterium]
MKKILVVILLIILSVISFAERPEGEQTPIYPSTLSIPIEKSKNIRTFTVYNTTTDRKSFEVGIKDEDNFGQISEVGKYLKVFPKKFSLEPGKSREIRVSAENLPEEMLGKGEYKAALLIKGLSSKVNEKYETKAKNGEITTTLNIKINISMGIYVLTGNEFEKVEIEKFRLNKTTNMYEAKIKNTGNYSYQVGINILDKNKKVLSKRGTVKLFPGITTDISFPIIKDSDKIEIELEEKETSLKVFEISDLLS